MAPSLIVFHIAVELRAAQSCSSFYPEPKEGALASPAAPGSRVRPFPLLAPRKEGRPPTTSSLPPSRFPSILRHAAVLECEGGRERAHAAPLMATVTGGTEDGRTRGRALGGSVEK